VEQDTDRDYWLSAEDAVKYGLVSRVINALDDVK
jgi:ATP-dependent Clp protease protease subunit